MPNGVRDLAAESSVEYGSRVGVWRLLDMFDRHNVQSTFFVCGKALERNPELGPALAELGHEACSHGYHWGEHFSMTEDEERREIRKAVKSIQQHVGQRPVGWYCRYASSQITRQLLAEEGGFIYDSDAYNDDLPYYIRVLDRPWLVVPYSADANDGRYLTAPGWSNSDQFYDYLISSFDQLYEEGASNRSIFSIGLHCRLSGRPGRARAIDRFLTYAKSHTDVWFARREDIARYWLEHYPAN
jgi:peptidoglycan/xylan/chitin deacetylase (PgdA/CDA1 family)